MRVQDLRRSADLPRCRNCGKQLLGKRPDARFCDSTCRSEAWRATHPPTNGAEPFRTASVQPRRVSRDGRGTHIYFTPEEIKALIDGDAGSVRHVLTARTKLAQAERRVET